MDWRVLYVCNPRCSVVHLLARTGFEVEQVYGDFFAHDLDNESDQMIWVAKKPKDKSE